MCSPAIDMPRTPNESVCSFNLGFPGNPCKLFFPAFLLFSLPVLLGWVNSCTCWKDMGDGFRSTFLREVGHRSPPQLGRCSSFLVSALASSLHPLVLWSQPASGDFSSWSWDCVRSKASRSWCGTRQKRNTRMCGAFPETNELLFLNLARS